MSNKLFQLSSIASLSFGNYEGSLKISNLLKKGNLGIGTFNDLDGEMVIIDKKCYQLKSDGTVISNTSDLTTPFASIVNFRPLKRISLSNCDLDKLKNALFEIICQNNKHFIYAFKIKGKFESVKTRTVSKQNKPYKKLVDVVSDQSVYEFKNQKGNLVGFYTPKELNTIGVEEFHLHYIDEQRKSGGHLFCFEKSELEIEISWISEMEYIITKNDFKIEYDIEKLQEEIKIAEKE